MDDIGNDIVYLAEQIKALNHSAYEYYKPITAKLCIGNAPEPEVESVLDRMLDFCGSDEILYMFKKICRCYYKEYPEMIAFEINAYKEMWDMD